METNNFETLRKLEQILPTLEQNKPHLPPTELLPNRKIIHSQHQRIIQIENISGLEEGQNK